MLTKILKTIQRWPIEKKKFFAILLAIFFTILILLLNFCINSIWEDKSPKTNYLQENAFSSMKESFSRLFDEARPALDRAISSTTEIIDQISSTTSSITR